MHAPTLLTERAELAGLARRLSHLAHGLAQIPDPDGWRGPAAERHRVRVLDLAEEAGRLARGVDDLADDVHDLALVAARRAQAADALGDVVAGAVSDLGRGMRW